MEIDIQALSRTVCLTATLILMNVSVSRSFWMEPSPVLISPRTVELEENALLELTCRVSDDYIDTHNATNVYFQKSRHYSVGHPYFSVISPREARLHVPMATYSVWRGIVFCGLDDVKTSFLHIGNLSANILFRRDPLPPKIETCVVKNWESLVCDWSPSLEEQLKHTKNKHHARYKFLWSLADDHHVYYCCRDASLSECPQDATNLTETCVLRTNSTVNPFNMGALYNLTVRAETDKAFSIDKWANGSTLNTTLHVKPNPPEDVSMAIHNKTHCKITWSRPVTSWQPARTWMMVYNISVISHFSEESFTVHSNNHQMELYVPFTAYNQYTVTIVTIPEIGGYYSDEATATLSTPSTVPTSNPLVHISGYVYDTTHCTRETCTATVYWKPVEPRDLSGPDFCYIVKTRELTEEIDQWKTREVIPDPERSSASLEVIRGQSVEVTIHALNKVGENQADSGVIRILAPDKSLAVREHLVIEVDDSEDRRLVSAWIDHPHNANYSVIWKIRGSMAPQLIGWTELPPDGRSVEISLGESSSRYMFGFMKTVEGANSGIIWRDDVMYSVNPAYKVLPPTDFRVLDIMMHSLTLSWEPHIYQQSYVVNYRIKFCVKDGRTGQCQDPVRYVIQNVPGQDSMVELIDLDPDTEYNISICSITRQSESEEVFIQGIARTAPALSLVAIVGIAVGAVVGFIVTVIGIYSLCKRCLYLKKWFTKGITIKFPEEVKSTRESTSSEMPLCRSSASSYLDYRRQISGVSDISSDGELYSFHGDDTSDNHQGGSLRVTYSPRNLDLIPEKNDDVFEPSDSSCDMFVKTYKLVPSNEPEMLPSNKWHKNEPLDTDVGGISKYAILSLDQKDETNENEQPGKDEKSNMEVVNELFQTLLKDDSKDRQSPSNNDHYLPNNCRDYVTKDWSLSPGSSRVGSPVQESSDGNDSTTLLVPNGHVPGAEHSVCPNSAQQTKDIPFNNNQLKIQGYLPLRGSKSREQSYINTKPITIPNTANMSIV